MHAPFDLAVRHAANCAERTGERWTIRNMEGHKGWYIVKSFEIAVTCDQHAWRTATERFIVLPDRTLLTYFDYLGRQWVEKFRQYGSGSQSQRQLSEAPTAPESPELWWQTKQRQEREQREKIIALRNAVRDIIGI